MDATDVEILRILQQDGRISVADLAGRVGLTVALQSAFQLDASLSASK